MHRSDVLNQMEKADFSGVRFHGHPAPAVISTPRGPISVKADEWPCFPKSTVKPRSRSERPEKYVRCLARKKKKAGK